MTIREQIISAAAAAITDGLAGLDPVPAVYRSRVEAFRPAQLPAVVIRPESDAPGDRDSTLCWCPWTLTLAVDIVVNEAPICQQSDELVELIHAAMMVSSNPPGGEDLGLPQYSVDVAPGACDWEASNDGDYVGVVTMRYAIRYQTSWGDLALFR